MSSSSMVPFVGSRENEVLQDLDESIVTVLPKQLTEMQRRCVPYVLGSDENFVLSAPTGSGKSWVLCFAILRELYSKEADISKKCIYLAPTRALCEQQSKWLNRVLSTIGIKAATMTGDTEVSIQSELIKKANILVFTPEKLDAMSRRWSDLKMVYASCTLLLVDEVHIMSEVGRGAVVECIVSRLQTIKKTLVRDDPNLCRRTHEEKKLLRIGAVSATVPNLNDLGRWLKVPNQNGVLCFGPEFRPVPLETIVIGYPRHGRNMFLFEKDLDNKVSSVLSQYGYGRQTLIFCSSRKGAKTLAERLASSQLLKKDHTSMAERVHREQCNRIKDDALRSCASTGIAWHHANVLPEDRCIVEHMFRNGLLGILTCTTTLALGMNLPASLVIIKSTKVYRGASEGMQDIDHSSLVQMIGRAGRPGFDTSGTAVLMTCEGEEHKFRNLLNGLEPIQSVLKFQLREILNAEIVLGFINSIEDALIWLETTFWYQCEKRVNGHPAELRVKLRNTVVAAMKQLVDLGCIEWTPDGCSVVSTRTGVLICRRYIRAETLKAFHALDSCGGYDEVLRTLSKADEFKSMVLRRNQKKWLNEVNWSLGKYTLPKKYRVTNIADKIFQLFQALLSKINPPDRTLVQETLKLAKDGPRILEALFNYLSNVKKLGISAQAFVLLRCLKLKSWPDDELSQLPNIGSKLVQKLHSLGVFTINDFYKVGTESLCIQQVLGNNRFTQCFQQVGKILHQDVSVRAFVSRNGVGNLILNPVGNVEKASNHSCYAVFVIQKSCLILHVRNVSPGYKIAIPKGVLVDSSLPITVHICHHYYHGLDKVVLLPPIQTPKRSFQSRSVNETGNKTKKRSKSGPSQPEVEPFYK